MLFAIVLPILVYAVAAVYFLSRRDYQDIASQLASLRNDYIEYSSTRDAPAPPKYFRNKENGKAIDKQNVYAVLLQRDRRRRVLRLAKRVASAIGLLVLFVVVACMLLAYYTSFSLSDQRNLCVVLLTTLIACIVIAFEPMSREWQRYVAIFKPQIFEAPATRVLPQLFGVYVQLGSQGSTNETGLMNRSERAAFNEILGSKRSDPADQLERFLGTMGMHFLHFPKNPSSLEEANFSIALVHDITSVNRFLQHRDDALLKAQEYCDLLDKATIQMQLTGLPFADLPCFIVEYAGNVLYLSFENEESSILPYILVVHAATHGDEKSN